MADRDLKNSVNYLNSVPPNGYTATVNGTGVDLKGYRGAMFLVDPETIADGTHTPKAQHSDDNSTWVDVPAAELDGSFANIASNTVQQVGYRGAKRHARMVVTVTGATGGGVYGAGILKGFPVDAPDN